MKKITHSEGRILCLYPTHASTDNFGVYYDATYPLRDGVTKTELLVLARKVLNRCNREGRGLIHFRKFDCFPTQDGIGYVNHDGDGVYEVVVSFAAQMVDCIHEHRHTFTVESK